MIPRRPLYLAALAAGLGLPATPAWAVCPDFGLPEGTEIVELETSLGSICLELLSEEAPVTVDNFIGYVERGDYDGSFLHRSIPGFALQGGGFALGAENEIVPVLQRDPIVNEPCIRDTEIPVMGGTVEICSERGNERGTVAMAKPADDPDSATSQWFINLTDNRPNLDNQNGGFSVFGRVLGEGMEVVDQIASLPDAAEGKMYWLNPIFVRARPGLFADTPLQVDPDLLPADSMFGCFDPDRLSIVVESTGEGAPALPIDGSLEGIALVSDPITGDFVFFVSEPCTTSIQPGTFQPQPGSDPSCPDLSQRVLAADDPLDPVVVDADGDGNVDEFEVSCAQLEEALTSREAWRADFKERLASELVVIERATLIQVPEPGAEALGAAALAVLGVLRRGRGRRR